MKNYLIAILVLLIIILSSFIYKNSKVNKFYNFPIVYKKDELKGEKHLDIYLFFSTNNCPSCLAVIPVLNKLSKDMFRVTGVVSENELKNEVELRKKTNASFELISNKKFKRYFPLYWPSIMGVSPKGRIYFILPAVPGEYEYLEEFLQTFYYNFYERIKN